MQDASHTTIKRKAYTLSEFAQCFGKHRSWAYRMARENRIKTISGFGNLLVPSHEFDRILGETATTDEKAP
jgi:hypothetical protein